MIRILLRLVRLAIAILIVPTSVIAQSSGDNDSINRYRGNPTVENFKTLSDFEKAIEAKHWLANRMSELPQYSAAARTDKFAVMEVQEDIVVRPYFEALSPFEKGNVAARAMDQLIRTRMNTQPRDGGTSDQLISMLESSIAANASDQEILRSSICQTSENLTVRAVESPENLELAARHREQSRLFLFLFFRTSLGHALSRTDCARYGPGTETPFNQLSRTLSHPTGSSTSRIFTPDSSVVTVTCSPSTDKGVDGTDHPEDGWCRFEESSPDLDRYKIESEGSRVRYSPFGSTLGF